MSDAECDKILTKNAIDKSIWLEFTHKAPEIENSII
jgi:hypothetical protein